MGSGGRWREEGREIRSSLVSSLSLHEMWGKSLGIRLDLKEEENEDTNHKDTFGVMRQMSGQAN